MARSVRGPLNSTVSRQSMSSADSTFADGSQGTPGRIIKVNHAGEFGAINIYRAQILIAKLLHRPYVAMLEDFLSHEQKHLRIFGDVLEQRQVARCKSYWLCGIGGFVLGLLTACLGRKGVMACTAAVETVVTRHLKDQIVELRTAGDGQALAAVGAIVRDEEHHRDAAVSEGFDCIFYRPLYQVIAVSTEAVIWLGMRL